MGENVNLPPLGVVDNSSFVTELNDRLDTLADEFDGVVYKDGSEELTGDLNAAGQRIYNLPLPIYSHEPLRLGDVSLFTQGPVGPSGSVEVSGIAWVTPQQFGAVPDGVTDNYTAFVAAINWLKTIANEPYLGWFYKGSPKLFIPAAEDDYYISDTLDITHTLIIEGEGGTSGMASRLRFPDNKTGIRIQSYNTNGNAGTDGSPYHYSGSGTYLRNFGIIGGVVDTEAGFSGSEGDYHGIHARAACFIEDVYVNGFRGDGLHVLTSAGGGGADEGNSNVSMVVRLRVTNVRNGVFLDGADANAWTLIGVNGTYCRQHTVWDSSFLGNTHIGHHSANAGLVPGVPASVVSYSGYRYGYRAAGASTNAPSGLATDNAYWYYIGIGGADASLNIPLWTNGVSVRAGGGYKTDSANGYNVFIGCYQEGGEAPSQFINPTVIMGGLLDARTTGNRYDGNRLDAPNAPTLGATKVKFTNGGASVAASGDGILVHNMATLGTFIMSQISLAQGYEANGVDACRLGGITAYSAETNPATNTGNLAFYTRSAGGTLTERFGFNTDNGTLFPWENNLYDIGATGSRWKTLFAMTGDFTTQVKVNGVKVLGAQGAALPADATDLATALTLINAMKARMVAHGLVA